MKLGFTQSLDRILESAVMSGWQDLMKDTKSGFLLLEYAFAPDSSLDYLKLWSSKVRGHWHLAASALHVKGIHFEDGFRSESLTQTLEFIIQHQSAFVASPNHGRNGRLQIQQPTHDQRDVAEVSVARAFESLRPVPMRPANGSSPGKSDSGRTL
jgi:hypothetical protein